MYAHLIGFCQIIAVNDKSKVQTGINTSATPLLPNIISSVGQLVHRSRLECEYEHIVHLQASYTILY